MWSFRYIFKFRRRRRRKKKKNKKFTIKLLVCQEITGQEISTTNTSLKTNPHYI